MQCSAQRHTDFPFSLVERWAGLRADLLSFIFFLIYSTFFVGNKSLKHPKQWQPMQLQVRLLCRYLPAEGRLVLFCILLLSVTWSATTHLAFSPVKVVFDFSQRTLSRTREIRKMDFSKLLLQNTHALLPCCGRKAKSHQLYLLTIYC